MERKYGSVKMKISVFVSLVLVPPYTLVPSRLTKSHRLLSVFQLIAVR